LLRPSEPGWYPYALSHGEGIHPLQWITSFFMHIGIGHLIGNMVFLWVFGIVVEGKTGPLVFVILYLSIGILENIAEQLLFLGIPAEPSLGASSVLYGLMVIAMFWAPGDNILCLIIVWITPILFRVPILIFAFLYLFMDFGLALFGGFEMGTPLLHVMGAAVGLFPAVLMLKMQWVDCEHYDLLSRIGEAMGKDPKNKKPTKRQKVEAGKQRLERKQEVASRTDQILRSLEMHLGANNVQAATRLMHDFRRRGGTVEWTESQLLKLIRTYQAEKNWNRVVEFSEEYIARFQQHQNTLRINLAKIWLVERALPSRALKALEGINLNELDEGQRTIAQQIIQKSQEMIDGGALELGDE
jgi:membrane associated rhomboid family serine protease